MVRGVNWTGTAHIGNAAAGADRGGKFAIHVVAASHETGKRFKAYLKNAHTTDSWPGLADLYDSEIVASNHGCT